MGKARSFKVLGQIMLTVMLALTVICGGRQAKVQAADMIEISGNTDISDSLESNDDVKYYKFTVSETGYFTISLKKSDPTVDVGWGWNVTLYDMEGNQIKECSGIGTSVTSEKLPFKKGNQYYIKVQKQSSLSDVGNVGYSLRIDMINDGSWEIEDNDTYSNANIITSGAAKNATLWNSGDEDYYKYVVDNTGYFTITLAKNDSTVDVGWGYHMNLYNSNHEQIDYYDGITSSHTTQKYSFPKGTVVYISITRQSSLSDIVGVDYSVKVTSVARSDWEIETMKDASASWSERISGVRTVGSKVVYGSLYRSYDNDVYKVVSPAAGTMSVTFAVNDVDTNLGDGYNVEIYNAAGNSLKNTGYVKSKTVTKVSVKAGTYYVVIKRENSLSEVTEKEYSITATISKKVKTPAVKKLSLKAKKKSVKVSWSKASGVTGYQIQYSTNKKFKKAKTVKVASSKKSYTIKKLKSNKKYYVRVRAYKKSGGKIVTGKYTAVKSVVVK